MFIVILSPEYTMLFQASQVTAAFFKEQEILYVL